jgi:hypothetical protein
MDPRLIVSAFPKAQVSEGNSDHIKLEKPSLGGTFYFFCADGLIRFTTDPSSPIVTQGMRENFGHFVGITLYERTRYSVHKKPIAMIQLNVTDHSHASEQDLRSPFAARVFCFIRETGVMIVHRESDNALFAVTGKHVKYIGPEDRQLKVPFISLLPMNQRVKCQFRICDQMIDGETGADLSHTWTPATVLIQLPFGYHYVCLEEYHDPSNQEHNWHMAFDVVKQDRLRQRN